MAERLIRWLEGAGYECFVPMEKRSCFDIAAKGPHFLLIKVFSNIDSLRDEQAGELKALAATLGAAPLIIGERSKSHTLERGMVYDRYGISALSAETLGDVLAGSLPTRRFFKGRVVAEIDGDKLAGASATELAKAVHVTREAIYSYRGGSRVEFGTATLLEKALDKELIRGINVFSVPHAEKPSVGGYLHRLEELGFDVVPVRRGYDALARERETLLVGAAANEGYARRKAPFVTKAAEFFESEPVMVMERRHETIKGVPVVSKGEIGEAESAEGLIDLVKKRKRQ
jgi:putative transcriptional regulator